MIYTEAKQLGLSFTRNRKVKFKDPFPFQVCIGCKFFVDSTSGGFCVHVYFSDLII